MGLLLNMKILAIDTATEACSAALLADDEIRERYELAPQRQAELILPMVDGLLAEAGIGLSGLDALAFGRGPGAFTGIRIAAGVTQGLAFGADLPVLPVSTLAALAQGAASLSRHLLCAIDARMDEIYWAAYDIRDGIPVPRGDEGVGVPDAVTITGGEKYYGVGSGWLAHETRLRNRLGDRYTGCEGERYPRARDMITLARIDFEAGRYVAAAEAAPVYLRDQVTG